MPSASGTWHFTSLPSAEALLLGAVVHLAGPPGGAHAVMVHWMAVVAEMVAAAALLGDLAACLLGAVDVPLLVSDLLATCPRHLEGGRMSRLRFVLGPSVLHPLAPAA